MNRPRMTTASSLTAIIAVTLTVTVPGTAQATTAKPPVTKTVHNWSHLAYKGPKGSYYRLSSGADIRLAPKFAQAGWGKREARGIKGVKNGTLSGRDVLVDGIDYDNYSGAWKKTRLDADTVRIWRQHADPAYVKSVFLRAHGWKRVSAHHLRIKGSMAKLAPYASWDLHYAQHMLDGSGIKTLTIDLYTDSRGRLSKLLFTGRSASATLKAEDGWNAYNTPVKIVAPH
ncbi:hypothetical protein [Actinomadura oligospora]|uniref:hypothetical protein n=1 Tax=Actinomadura oligospora TaxID=111804 RepID=UPI0004BA1A7A|nr:hypothetical protein [Actinomadura oligospora]